MSDVLTYTVKEAAAALGVGKNRVYDLVAAGEVPHVRFGRVIRIPIASLEAWLEKQVVQSAPR